MNTKELKSILLTELEIMEALDIEKIESSDIERFLESKKLNYDQSSIEFDGSNIHVMVEGGDVIMMCKNNQSID